MNPLDQKTATVEQRTFQILLVAASLGFAWILLPFFGTIMWGAIIALLFAPVNRSLLARMPHRPTIAALLTLLLVLLIVILPFALVTTALAREGAALYHRMQSGEMNPESLFRTVFTALPGWVTDLLARFGLDDYTDLPTRLAAGLSQAGESALFSSSVLVPLGLGFVMSIAFFFWSKNRTDAALDLRLFAQPVYRWASLVTLVLGIAFGLMFLSFYLLFTGVWHYSQATAGLAATPGPLLATLVAAGLSQRFSKDHFHRPMLLGGLIFALSNTWLAMRVQLEPAYLTIWLPGQLLSGIAIGLMLPSIAAAAVSTLPQHQLGIGSAVNTALRQLGSSLGVALAVALVGSGYAAIAPFQLVYACLTVCGCLVATIAWKLRSRPACSMD